MLQNRAFEATDSSCAELCSKNSCSDAVHAHTEVANHKERHHMHTTMRQEKHRIKQGWLSPLPTSRTDCRIDQRNQGRYPQKMYQQVHPAI